MPVHRTRVHVIVSFVATGHVLFIEADTRRMVECICTSPGVNTIRQAHMSTPSPDGRYVTVANQNGKRFERIRTDYETNTFIHEPAATLDLATCKLNEFSTTPNAINSPAPGIVFNESHIEHADAHGAAMARQDKYLWLADRGRNFLWVVDTRTDQVVNRIELINELSLDPTPDLMHLSPNGSHAVVALRGPTPLSGDPHVSTGSTPGGVQKVTQAGRNARFESIARITNLDTSVNPSVERADVHGIAVRLKVH